MAPPDEGTPPHGPEGSALDEARGEVRAKRLSRRVRQAAVRALITLAANTLPRVYMAYCWLVWRTSRVEWEMGPLEEAAQRHGKFVALLWHQEVFTVAYAYRSFGGHTLASVSDFGRIVTRMLELCNFHVFRGGSSEGRKRKRRVLPAMVHHMQTTPQVLYGITVDGSKGPAYELKAGALLIARACGAPMFVTRASYKRRIELPTWDRTWIPLPFNRIQLRAVGPYWLAPEASTAEVEATRAHLERELLDLCYRCNEVVAGRAQPVPVGFPAGWRPRWAPGGFGLRRREFDLDPDRPPRFATPPVRAAGMS